MPSPNATLNKTQSAVRESGEPHAYDPIAVFDRKKAGLKDPRPYGWKIGLKPRQDADELERTEKINYSRKLHLLKQKQKRQFLLQKAVDKMMADPNYRKMYQNYKEAHGGNLSSAVSIYDSALASFEPDGNASYRRSTQLPRRASMGEAGGHQRL